MLLVFCAFSLLVDYSQGYITYIEVKYPLKGRESPPGSPWPLPQKWLRTEKVLTIHPDIFSLRSDKRTGCDVIDKAINRYRGLMFSDIRGQVSPHHQELDELRVNINDTSCGYPRLGDDESYEIDIPMEGKEALLNAQTVWGAIRGLETFSQLVYQNSSDRAYLINATRVEDWPQYKYRGLLVDTARHFQPMRVLLDNLDAMAYNKLNAFHWHIVDDQSFPLESKLFPNLTILGAYSRHHVYSQRDVKKVIEEARLRGIRVIPEIDTPGHTQGFAKAFPNLLTPCYVDGKPLSSVFAKHAKAEILNPTQNYTYDFFKMFFREIRSVFVDDFIHLGMDEVYYDCWESNPQIREFMAQMDMKNVSQLEQYYVKRTLKNVKEMAFKAQIWQDPIDNGVQPEKDTVVQIWKDTELVSSFKRWQEYILPVAQQKYQMVVSACYYLNYISYGEDWKKYYNCDPREFNGTDEEKALVIGGEACMWSEFVDGTNILARLWPRASAVAERLWSNPQLTSDADNAKYRLDEHRCRMIRRGIPAQPILNGFCGDEDWLFANSGNHHVVPSFLSILFLVLPFQLLSF